MGAGEGHIVDVGPVWVDAQRMVASQGGELGAGKSAGVYVVTEYPWPVCDLRVDWAEEGPIAKLRELHPGPLLANVNPANAPSHKLWESLGGKIIQVTYEV